MPSPVSPRPDDDFDGPEPESVEILLSEHLKNLDDASVDSQVSTDSIKPKSKISDYHFDSGLITPSGASPFPSASATPGSASAGSASGSAIPSDAPFPPGFAGRDSSGEPGTDPDDDNSEESRDEIPSIEGYVILRELGRGGMGVVYKAKQMKLERVVALKMILHHGYLTKETLTRFRTEADALARVAHPGIVQVYEIVEREGEAAYFTLEYCGGGSLAREIKKGPFAPKRAAEVVEQLARAIHFAHEANIIHRDLKPGNILRTTLGQYKITDFGLAKKLDIEENITQSGAIIGTPGYMAPEQASGDLSRVGPPCDIYALGVILYECVTGRVPFRAQNVMDAVIQVVTLEPVAPSRLEPKTPKDLETIILKCLHKTPERRYRTAAELGDDLGRFLRGEPILGRPASLAERSWKWVRKHPAVSGALAMSVLALFGFLGMIVLQNRELETEVARAVKQEQVTATELQERREADRRREQTEKQRVEARGVLAEAVSARGERKWSQVADLTTRLIAKSGDDAELANEIAEAKLLKGRAEDEIAFEKRLQESKATLVKFNDLRDRVRFLSSPYTKLDLASREKAITQECRAGLKMFVLEADLEAVPKLAVPEIYDETQSQQVRDGCYELFLLMADAIATPRDGDTAEQKAERAKQAMALLTKAAPIKPEDPSWTGRAAHYCYQSGNPLLASDIEFKGEARVPNSAFDYFLVGENNYLLGKLPEAKKNLAEALRKQPDHFWAQYLLAEIALRSDKPSPAQANVYLNFCITQKPDFAPLYVMRGVANEGLNLFAQAEEDFETALAKEPADATRYSILVNRATTRLRQNKFDEALADFTAAKVLRPNEAILHLEIGLTQWRRKSRDEAFAALDKAIEIDPKFAAAYAARGRFRQEAGDGAKALDDNAKAIELQVPNSAEAMDLRLERADWLSRTRKYPEAILVCDDALKLTGQPDEKKVRALTLKVAALHESKRPAEVLETLEKASKLGWKPTAESLRYRGLTYARLGKLPEAIADLTAVIEKAPTAQSYSERGWLLVRGNMVRDALADFDKSISLEPGADALCGRAYARVYLNKEARDIQTALRDAAEALRLGGDSSRVLYHCAQTYALAAARLPQPEKVNRPVSRAADPRADYQERAADLLARTLEKVPADQRSAFWKESVARDDAIRSLAGLPSFVKLQQRYDPKAATQP